MCPFTSICITRHGIESDAASFEISCVAIESDVFPMLLHYKTGGDRLSITGRMAGSIRGSRHHCCYGWLRATWLEQGLTGSQWGLKCLRTQSRVVNEQR